MMTTTHALVVAGANGATAAPTSAPTRAWVVVIMARGYVVLGIPML